MNGMNTGAQIDAAMVLAAGYGSRMRPLTDLLPKPLVQLAGRPLLDHVLDRLAGAGIARAVVNVHHMAAQIEAHLKWREKPRIFISDERGALLETGGAVKKALGFFESRPFFVHNSDSVWTEGASSNLRLLMRAWTPTQMDVLLLLARRDSSIGYEARGDFHLAASGRLTRRTPGHEAPYVFAGVSILQPELFEDYADPVFSLNAIFDRAGAAERLHGVVLDGTWMHVGTPQALKEAEAHLNEVMERHA
jgi:N-acetyl-alpha-D-muramate 1-phosphate uridylyltransferase